MIRFPNKNRELSHCLESLVSMHFKYLFYEKDKFNYYDVFDGVLCQKHFGSNRKS